ncbi:MAG: hypothetical protein AAF620_00030 [Bacteroidota bacterium]
MRRVIRVGLILNYLFWGGMFAYAFALFVAYNGIFEVFEFNCKYADEFSVSLKENKKSYYVRYSYIDNSKIFSNKEGISKDIYDQQIGDVENLEICYNRTFPTLSYLKGKNLALRRSKVGMVVSSIFLTLFVLIDLFSDKEKWANRYEKVFGIQK